MTSSFVATHSMMPSSYGSCPCPFCTRKAFFPFSWRDASGTWRVWTFMLLLLSAKVLAKKSPSSAEGPSVALYSQKIHIDPSENECSSDNCHCYSVGKCQPCSSFEIGRQDTECLLTGYKQLAYCSEDKKEKYVSCHFEVDPREGRRFWMFEGVILLVGTVSYSVVYLRQRRIERIVARRIQQQINA